MITLHHPLLRTHAEATVEDGRFWVRNAVPGRERSLFYVGLEDHQSVAENDGFNIKFKIDADGFSRSVAVRLEREKFGAFSSPGDSSPPQNIQIANVMFIVNPRYHEASKPVTFVSKSSQVRLVSVKQSGAIYFVKYDASGTLPAGHFENGVMIEAVLGDMIVSYARQFIFQQSSQP